MPDTPTLSERVRANCPEIDQDLLQEIRGAANLAGAKSVYAAGNGRWPRWSFDRWLNVGGIVVTIIVWVFLSGGRWDRLSQQNERAERTMNELQLAVKSMQSEMGQMKVEIFSIQRVDEYYRTHPRTGPMFEGAK